MIKITNDAVAVVLEDQPTMSGIIHLPEKRLTRSEVYSKGLVKYVGNKFKYKDDVKVGDTVLVPNHLGARVTIKGKNLVLYLSEDVLALVI